jgi:hypothetical protein
LIESTAKRPQPALTTAFAFRLIVADLAAWFNRNANWVGQTVEMAHSAFRNQNHQVQK